MASWTQFVQTSCFSTGRSWRITRPGWKNSCMLQVFTVYVCFRASLLKADKGWSLTSHRIAILTFPFRPRPEGDYETYINTVKETRLAQQRAYDAQQKEISHILEFINKHDERPKIVAQKAQQFSWEIWGQQERERERERKRERAREIRKQAFSLSSKRTMTKVNRQFSWWI